MQRSLADQKSLAPFVYVVLFALYISLSSIYLFLPPLLSILFVLYVRYLKNEDALGIFLIAFCFIVFEAEKGYWLFSSIIFFSLAYKFILPKLEQNFNCPACIKASYVLLSYVGFYLFCVLVSNIFLLPMPALTYYIIYYIIIEFFLVSLA